VRVGDGRLVVEVVLPVVGPETGTAFSARVAPADSAGSAGSAGSVEGEAASTRLWSATSTPTTPSITASATTDVGEQRSTITVTVDLSTLAAAGDGPWRMLLAGEIEAGPFDVRVPGPREEVVSRFWHRGRPARIVVGRAAQGRDLEIRVDAIPAREVASAVLRRARRRG
jgi:hypothetical protein